MKASVTLSGVVRFTNKVGGSVLIHATASADIFCEFIHPINALIFPTSFSASPNRTEQCAQAARSPSALRSCSIQLPVANTRSLCANLRSRPNARSHALLRRCPDLTPTPVGHQGRHVYNRPRL